MANRPSPDKTFVGLRVPNEVVSAADECAEADSASRTDVLLTALREYLRRRGFLPEE